MQAKVAVMSYQALFSSGRLKDKRMLFLVCRVEALVL